MAKLGALGPQVVAVGLARRHLDRDPLGDGKAVRLELLHLVRVVGHEAHFPHAQVEQDVRARLVVAHVGGEAQRVVRLHRVATLVLQRIGADLVEQADAAALVEHVDQHAGTRFLDRRERRVELLAAIAALGAEDVAREAL